MAGEGNVQLRLGVSLDLAYMRQQFETGIPALAKRYPLIFTPRLDVKNVKQALKLLEKQATININDSQIDAARTRLSTLNKSLATLRKATNTAIEVKVRYTEEGKAPAGVGGRSRTFRQRLETVDPSSVKELYRAAGQAGIVAFNEAIANNKAKIITELNQIGEDAVAGLLNGLKSKDAQLQAAAKSLGQSLISFLKGILGIASPSKVFRDIGDDVGKGFELGAVASMDKAFDALERKLQERLRKLQGLLQPQTSRRGAFPFVAKTGPIESQTLIAESISLAQQLDQARSQLAQIQERKQGRLTFEREALAASAGRMLPSGTSAVPLLSAQDTVLKSFYDSVQNAERTLRQYFSANSYLPAATRSLADSMQRASREIRALPAGKGPIAALPSEEMMRPIRGRRSLEKALRIDFDNAIRNQMEGRLLPSGGRTSYAQNVLSGQQFNAPSLTGKKADVFGAMEGTGNIAERLRAAAVQFSRNAPAVIKYLNLFSTAGGIDIANLPGANESPGQYIRRIQQSLSQTLKQGGLGAGTVPPAGTGRSYFEPGRGPQVPGMPLQLALPAAGQTTAAQGPNYPFDRVRGGGGGRGPGGALGFLATPLSDKYFENARKYSAALDVAAASVRNFSGSQLPLAGGLRGLAAEFGEATKQVLLYGTAYKGLAFVTSLPGQILNAAKSQQQYANSLQVATQESGTFAKELLYVDNVQRAFGLNLETTRQGFTRLYASMAPAGFDSGSIEKLFTGISAASAALQLTPDKAERVIYAFGQMASKGQVMSEELKGQLGDVLPGALAIFAKAAGKSVKEFNAELEKGVYSGSQFRELMTKVTDELINRFGSGAAAAGRSLQGLMNTVQGDFQRTLEAFAPLANSAAQAILVPLGGALKQLSTAAQIATGELERIQGQIKDQKQIVVDLKVGGAKPEQIRAAEQSLAALEVRYRALSEAAKDPAIIKQAADIQKFTTEIAKAGTFVMNLAQTIGNTLSPIVNFLGTNLTTVISLITSFYIGFQTARLAAMALMGALMLYRGLSALLGFGPAALQATALAGAFNVLGVSATGAQVQVVGLRLALTALVATTVIGAVVAGIVAIAGAFASMGDKARDAAQASKDAAKAAIDAARSGSVAGAAMGVQNILTEARKATAARQALEAIYARSTPEQRKGVAPMAITPEESVALQGTALTAGMISAGVTKGGGRQIRVPSKQELQKTIAQFGSLAGQQALDLREAKEAVKQAEAVSKKLGINQPSLNSIAAEGPNEKELEKQRRAQEKLANQRQQLAIDAANRQNALDELSFNHRLSLNEAEFDHYKQMLDARFAYEMSGLNSIEARQKKFQEDLKNIELRRVETIRKAQAESAKANIQATAAIRTATAARTGATGLLQGSTGISSGPHFDVRRADGGRITETEARALFSEEVRRRLTMTSGYGPRRAPTAGASTFHRGIDLAGPANTPLSLATGYSLQGVAQEGGLGYAATVSGPQGQMYKVGHLQKPGPGFSMQRREARAGGQEDTALLQAQLKNKEKLVALEEANALAIAQTASVIRQNIDTIFPTAELSLETELLQMRNNLQAQGLSPERIAMQEKSYKAEKEAALATEKMTIEIARLQTERQRLIEKQQQGKVLSDGELSYLEAIPSLIATQRTGLENLTVAQQAYNQALQNSLFLQEQQNTPQAILANAYGQAQQSMKDLLNIGNLTKSIAGDIGNSFGQAFTDIASGSMSAQEALAGMMESIASSFLNMAAQIIAQQITMVILGTILKALGVGGGLGSMGGGDKFGSFDASGGFGTGSMSLPGLGGAGALSPAGMYTGVKFADGGVVTGPTLGLVGEGKYNEAIVPLPDGRSIPVQLQDGSIRDKMGGDMAGAGAMPMLSMSFQTTTINGVEYVDRAQLEAAMAETRRISVREGATRGATIALDKLANSPSSRRRVGLR